MSSSSRYLRASVTSPPSPLSPIALLELDHTSFPDPLNILVKNAISTVLTVLTGYCDTSVKVLLLILGLKSMFAEHTLEGPKQVCVSINRTKGIRMKNRMKME